MEDVLLPESPSPELQLPEAEEREVQGSTNSPGISFHALTGQVVPSTLKIAGSIKGQGVIVLIDGGSTNNFVQTKLANHLHLVVNPAHSLRVTVGNGDAVPSMGSCSEIKLRLGETTFTVDLILLPIYGADIVLGVQWLRQFGPVIFDYTEMYMEFDYLGQRVRLQGWGQLQYDVARPASFRKSDPNTSQFF